MPKLASVVGVDEEVEVVSESSSLRLSRASPVDFVLTFAGFDEVSLDVADTWKPGAIGLTGGSAAVVAAAIAAFGAGAEAAGALVALGGCVVVEVCEVVSVGAETGVDGGAACAGSGTRGSGRIGTVATGTVGVAGAAVASTC
jgi:hypothetical protein